jgi:hypothetical protein
MEAKAFKRDFLIVLLFGCVLNLIFLFGAGKASAHEVSMIIPDGISLGQSYSFEHDDQAPFKGYAQITVTNTGTQSWGDFHFQIYSLYPNTFWSNPADVFFVTSDPYAPAYKNGDNTIALDSYSVTPGTSSAGAMLDLYFYSHPLLANETATFTVYTDNTKDQGFFGLTVYPSPVPIPAAAWLFGSGLFCLLARKRIAIPID